MGYDVFISYSTQDKLTADAVCAILESQGIRCWIAPRDISLGSDWTESIVDAIELCPVMALVFSKHANESHQIKREVNLAIDHGLTVIPIRVEDVMPSKSLKFSININHWLDAFPPPLENHLQLLGQAIRGHLRVSSSETEPGKQVAQPQDPEPEIQIQPQGNQTASTHAVPPQQASICSSPLPDTGQVEPQPRELERRTEVSKPPRKRNIYILIAMGFLWTLLIFILESVIFNTFCDLTGLNKNRPGLLGVNFLISQILMGLTIWLTVRGKLPGTRFPKRKESDGVGDKGM